MSAFVLDCSIAVSWCFDDEFDSAADALLERVRDDGALVPTLWHLEVANVLLQAEWRGRLSPAATATRLELIGALPITTDDAPRRATYEILTLARGERLTTYDAAYLDLALRRGLALASRDKALLAAARRNGVATLPE